MKTAGIFYFSGTGNTELVAAMLKKEFESRQYTVDLIRMEDVLKKKLTVDVGRYDIIGFGSPVLGFASPSLVSRFVRALPRAEGKAAFVFRTAGGVAPINFNASKPIIRKLKRKGYNVFYERIFSISSNWVFRYDDDVIAKLYEATRKKAGLMCEALIHGDKRMLKTGLFRKLLMEIVMAVTPPSFRMTGKFYAVNQSCTHCGLCVRNCPAGNIVDRNGKIKFKLSCNLCMRCIYACPQDAIRLRMFSFFKVPGGYDIKKFLEKPISGGEAAKRPSPAFLESYLHDDAM